MKDNEEFSITTADDRTDFEPGEMIEVVADWQLEEPPQMAEVRLIWYTRGKGDSETELVQSIPLALPKATDNRRCEILLPESPYSFSGQLISLIWAVELVLGKKLSTRLDLVVAPGAKEIQLTPIKK